MTSRALINPLPKNSGVSLRATIQNPRPRKYASDADRQKAFRERQAMIQIRVAPKAVETFDEIAETLGYSRQEVVYALLMKGLMSLGNWETVGLPVDWQRKMPQFKLPRYEENPIMRKATPAQLAARERFAEMARSGAFKRKKNPMVISKQADDSLSKQGSRGYVRKLLDRYSDEGHVVSVKKTRSGSIGIAFDGGRMLTVASARKKLEDYFGITDTMKRRSNPAKKNPLGVSGGRYEIRRLDKSNAIDSVYTTLTHAKSAIDEIDRPAGSFYIVDTETGKHYFSFQAETKYPHIEIRGTAMQKAYDRNPVEAKERKPRVVLITNPKGRDAVKYAYALVLDDGGFTYGMDARTPVTFEFSQRDRKRGVYTSYALPSAAVLNPDFQAMVKSLPGQQYIGTLTELRALVKKFI